MTTGQTLHDRMTRGLPLTDVEQAHLDEWYAQQDAAESLLLSTGETPKTLEGLQTQIKVALSQVALMTQRIQDLLAQQQ